MILNANPKGVLSVRTITSTTPETDRRIKPADDIIHMDCTAGSLTLVFPTAQTPNIRPVLVDRLDANAEAVCTLMALEGETIAGRASVTLAHRVSEAAGPEGGEFIPGGSTEWLRSTSDGARMVAESATQATASAGSAESASISAVLAQASASQAAEMAADAATSATAAASSATTASTAASNAATSEAVAITKAAEAAASAAAATVILHGNGAPGNEIGNDGDYYLDQTTENLYGPKATSTWPAGVPLQAVISSISGTPLPAGSAPTVTTGGTPSARTITLGLPVGNDGIAVANFTDLTVDFPDRTPAKVLNDPDPTKRGEYRKAGGVGAGSWVKADAWISPTDTTFFTATASKNLFDKTKATAGFFVNSGTGALSANATYSATDYIPVTAGNQYTVSYGHKIAFYDAAHVFLSGSDLSAAGYIGSTVTAPANAAWMRGTLVAADADQYQVEAGATKTFYEAFGTKLTVDAASLKDVTPDRSTFLLPRAKKNMVNAAKVLVGFDLNPISGWPQPAAGKSVTDFIPVEGGATYINNYAWNVAYYDANKALLSFGSLANDTTFTFTVPGNAAYMRHSFVSTRLNTLQIEPGVTVTAYEAYSPVYYVPASMLSGLSVGPDQATFLVGVRGKNLFNPAEAVSGYYIASGSGNLSANASYTATGFIPVSPNTTYATSYGHQTAFFTANKAYISGISNAGNSTFTTPANAAFVRQGVPNSSLAAFQIELGNTPTAHEAYSYAYQIPASYLPTITSDKLPVIPADKLPTVPVDKIPVITPDKTSFMALGKNLYDRTKATDGFYVSYLVGTLSANATYSATDYIPVQPNTAYAVSFAHQTAFYDSNKVFISGVNLTGPPTATFTTPANAAFVRTSCYATDKGIYQIELGTVSTPYEAYLYRMLPQYIPTPVIADIILPRKIYALLGGVSPDHQQTNIYFREAVTGNLSRFFIDIAASYGRQYKDFYRLEPGNTAISHYNISAGSFALTLTVLDDSFTALKTAATTIQIIDKTKTTTHRHLAIGDSITRHGGWVKQIRDVLPNIVLKGIRHYTYDDAGLNREGRGGWTIDGYVTLTGNTAATDYSPFVFPQGTAGAKFWGNTEFWKKVVNTDPTGYDYNGFQKIARGWQDAPAAYLFDANGYPLAPAVDDVVVDPTLAAGSRYRKWDGGTWVTMAPQPTMEVNFSKYMERFAEAYKEGGVVYAPDSVSIMLSTNTFASLTSGPTQATKDAWVANMTTLINSIKAYNANIKIIVVMGIDVSTQDAAGGNNGCGVLAERGRRNMQEAARLVLATWDNDTALGNGIHVAPMMLNFDAVNGFDFITEAAFKSSTTNLSIPADFIHPQDAGHKQMGDSVAAVVQVART